MIFMNTCLKERVINNYVFMDYIAVQEGVHYTTDFH